MVRFFAAIMACIALGTAGTSIASAKQCRDASGKFTKCATTHHHKHCRDAKTGKFVKCSTMGGAMGGAMSGTKPAAAPAPSPT